jgi:hypothetical protein
MITLEERVKLERKSKKKNLEVMDKTEMFKLNAGAESSSTEESEEDDDETEKPKRN